MKEKMCHPLRQNDWQVYKTKPNSTSLQVHNVPDMKTAIK